LAFYRGNTVECMALVLTRLRCLVLYCTYVKAHKQFLKERESERERERERERARNLVIASIHAFSIKHHKDT